MKPRSLAIITLAATLIAIVTPAVFAQGGPPPAKVVLGEARVEQVDIRRDVIGRLRAPSLSRLAAEQPGRVNEVLIDAGDPVTKDQPIVRLDTTILQLQLASLQAELAAERANLRERQARLNFAQRDLDRVTSLNQRGSATDREVDDAQTERDVAEAQAARASADISRIEADIATLQQRIDDMIIRAPFDGAVTRKLTEVGEWVGEGDVVADLVRLDKVDAYVDIPERFVDALSKPDASVTITVDPLGMSLATQDFALIPDGDELARTFPLRVRLDNPNQRMKPGMSVTASVPTGATGRMLTIPKDAVLRNDAGPFVFINDNGTGAARQISILFATRERFAIQRGPIDDGTAVVVVGNERMFPGQPLEIIDEAPIPEPPAEATATANDDESDSQRNSDQNTDTSDARG